MYQKRLQADQGTAPAEPPNAHSSTQAGVAGSPGRVPVPFLTHRLQARFFLVHSRSTIFVEQSFEQPAVCNIAGTPFQALDFGALMIAAPIQMYFCFLRGSQPSGFIAVDPLADRSQRTHAASRGRHTMVRVCWIGSK